MENDEGKIAEKIGEVTIRNPRALAEAFQKFAGGRDTPPRPLPQQHVTFTMAASGCVPGVFAEDFDITLRAITPALELEAMRAANGEMMAMAFEMARRSIVAFNGAPVPAGMDEWLWVALGTGGRQIVTGMFARLTGSEEAQGKALATLRVH